MYLKNISSNVSYLKCVLKPDYLSYIKIKKRLFLNLQTTGNQKKNLILKISLLGQEQSQITQDRNLAVGLKKNNKKFCRYALSTNESSRFHESVI